MTGVAALLLIALVGCPNRESGTRTSAADTLRGADAAKRAAPAGVATYSVTIVNQYPHDATAFTEGLEWHDGALYESSGLVGHSWVRRQLLGGTILAQVQLPPPAPSRFRRSGRPAFGPAR